MGSKWSYVSMKEHGGVFRDDAGCDVTIVKIYSTLVGSRKIVIFLVVDIGPLRGWG